MRDFSTVLFIMGISFIILFIYSILRQRNQNAVYFSLLCLAKASFFFGYSFELNSKSIAEMIFFIKMQYMGLPLMPFFWFLFLHKYYYNKYASFKKSMVFLIIPVLTIFLGMTNEYHGFLFQQISISKFNGMTLSRVVNGPWYYIFIFYCFICVFFSFFIFLKSWKKQKLGLKTQSFWLFIGNALFIIFFISYFYNSNSFGIKIYLFGFMCTSITFLIVLFKYNLLEVEDIVRSITFSNVREGIIVTDTKGKLIDFNNSAKNIFDWVNPENMGKEISIFDEGFLISKRNAKDFEIELIKNGQKQYYDIHVMPLKEKEGIFGNVYILQDITKQKELLIKLSDLANIDSLTGLCNRRKFFEQTQHEISKAKKNKKNISSLMIDVDNFKMINDSFGHLAGDKVLKIIAQEIKNKLRDTDVICRYGGEEFAAILIETDLDKAYLIAESIRKRISNISIKFNKQQVFVTVSIGISSKDNENLSVYKLIDDADKALYRAKRSGRNIVITERG